MFADVVLTRRVERAEAELTASVARAVAAATRVTERLPSPSAAGWLPTAGAGRR